VGPRSVPGELRTLLLSDFRVAGAEFRHLAGNLADYFDGVEEGLLVVRVIPETPASRLGLREGDVVVEVEGRECRDVHSLRRAVAEAGPDGDVSLTWVRKGERQSGNLRAN
jgi:S1-C subfamily serine protease